MFKLEDSLWWYVGMRRIVHNLLTRAGVRETGDMQVLDAGCGTGGALHLLNRYGRVTSFDFYPKAAEMYLSREKGRIFVASTDAIPFKNQSFDLVTSFDVVCQLDPLEEEKALSELSRVLKPGGTLVVRVPAMQALYGAHDVTLHTKHRYSAPEMTRKLEKAGLRPVQTTYANTLLFPVALVRRFLSKVLNKPPGDSDVRPVPAPLNGALESVLNLEAGVLARRNLPLGLSVIALARKP